MRLLHTSDWHLGRALHGAPMLEHQRGFLAWLIGTAARQRVDAVLVAGDVYDRAVPPTDAVAVLDEALAGFAAHGIPVVLISGNHDSAVRLGFGTSLARHAGIHLRTGLSALTDPVVIDDVGIYGIPYLLPDAVLADLGADRSHTSVLDAALTRVRADAAARGLDKIVVLAHAFVTGGSGSESERDIRVGGIGDVPASVFTGITYAALGHLHGPQQVAPNVRYAGSPLPHSLSERAHHKSVALVEIDGAGSVDVELLATPVPRPMAELRGRLEDLLAASSGPSGEAWVRAVLTDQQRPANPMERLRERWPHTLVLDFAPESEAVDAASELVRVRTQTDPAEICSLFVEWVDSTYPDRRQRDELSAVIEAVRDGDIASERSA
jgi:DNA repair protein SbcD/Mre11